jgi:hypothetical protein
MTTPRLTLLFLVLFGGSSALRAQSQQLDLAIGYNYQNSDQGNGIRSNLNGWYSNLRYDLTDTISVTAEIDNYCGSLQRQSLKQQNYVAGPQITFRNAHARWRPFIFIQAGDQRSSSLGIVTHSFDLQIGGGVQTKLSDRISLQITPAEYNLAIIDSAV